LAPSSAQPITLGLGAFSGRYLARGAFDHPERHVLNLANSLPAVHGAGRLAPLPRFGGIPGLAARSPHDSRASGLMEGRLARTVQFWAILGFF